MTGGPDEPQPITDCREGVISPQVALARMLFGGYAADDILSLLEDAAPEGPLAIMRSLAATHRVALDSLSAEVGATAQSHDASGATPAEGAAKIAAFFDRAVRHSPEASVALYSLGDPGILAAATLEVVLWLDSQSLLPPDADVVDVGCGIGRIAAALAPRCRSVLALDVSAGMVEEAARRLAAVANVAVRQTDGANLASLPSAAFDLILAIDSFPYIVQAGAAAAHVQDAARALRPGGAFCILNLSYRQDPEADRRDSAAWAAASGLRLRHAGLRPFTLWDADATVLVR